MAWRMFLYYGMSLPVNWEKKSKTRLSGIVPRLGLVWFLRAVLTKSHLRFLGTED
jgi:hypothetical protein